MRRHPAFLGLIVATTLLAQVQSPSSGGAQLAVTPVKATMPTFKLMQVTASRSGRALLSDGPLESLPMEFRSDGFRYRTKEYFVSGIAQGQPYTTRILVRRPEDPKKFSGIVVAEPMHPTGNDWMYYFLSDYIMSEGHIAVEIVTANLARFKEPLWAERYKELAFDPNQANEIIAQVGLLLKSSRYDGPLEGLQVRKLILMGTSASAAAIVAYLPAHMIYRGDDMMPIFDGFLPTSIGADTTLMKVDVPIVQMPTMTEVVRSAATGNRYRRPDGDAPGDQFRIYEVAGMAHIGSRANPVYIPNPCKDPMSDFPEGMGLTAGLAHLIQWVDKGKTPPRAPYVTVDNDTANDGSVLALDANGNPKGGVRNTYVDVPAYRYVSPNEPASPPIPNPSTLVASQGPGGPQLFCGIASAQFPLSADRMKTLYKSKKDYQSKVEQRANALIKEGWLSPAYKDLILADAAKVNIP